MIRKDRLLERFLRYVRMETTANPDSQEYPSSPGQWELGRVLCAELQAMGWEATQDAHALVFANIPGNDPKRDPNAPVVAFNAHMDTSPDASGANVQPQVIESYAGGDIRLPGHAERTITVEASPELADLHGCTLVTTDGTTLLGGDDKAGVAIIMELAATLAEHPQIPHGDIRILFTCDEEIGRGVDKVDVPGLNATVCYTLDGPAANTIDVETFSADQATVRIQGVNIHPAIAKGKMVNAIRAAAAFVDALPREELAPESTDGRDGFLHPFRIVEGHVDQVVLQVLLRDFDTEKLADHADRLRSVGAEVMAAFPGTRVEVDIQRQYRNLADGLLGEPRAVRYAEEAYRRLGRTSERCLVRGGTDGSRFTELGLPTPNLSSGQHNLHSPLEWVCVDEMVAAVEVLVELVQVWADDPDAA